MRYIKKLDIPQFFIHDTNNLISWDDYYSDKKRVLKEYLSKEEQNYLCCYCEDKIDINNSHIEHIKPKSLDIENLTFDYYNLSVSCNGTCRNIEEDNTRYNCGHNKDNSYNENLFLNPTLVVDISDYFKYETYFENSMSKVRIKESVKDVSKAQYMLSILNLNDEDTNITRARYLEFTKFEEAIISQNLTDEEIQIWLEEENPPFISFLRYKYKNII